MTEDARTARRKHLVGLLVYFPELADLAKTSAPSDNRAASLRDLLEPGDAEIVREIPQAVVDAEREALFSTFKPDFPVGF